MDLRLTFTAHIYKMSIAKAASEDQLLFSSAREIISTRKPLDNLILSGFRDEKERGAVKPLQTRLKHL